MSDYFFKAKNKKTGEVIQVTAMDNHFGHHRYGYKTGNRILTEEEFWLAYDDVEPPTPMKGVPVSEPKRCCDRCALYHISLGRPPELIACAKKFCECHVPVSDKITRDALNDFTQESMERNDKILERYLNGTPVSEPSLQGKIEKLRKDPEKEFSAPRRVGTVAFIEALAYNKAVDDILALVEKPTPTPPTDNRPEAVLDRVLTKVGATPTPPPTGNPMTQEKADALLKGAQEIHDTMVAPPPTEWITELKETVFYNQLQSSSQSGLQFFIERAITQALAEQKARMVEVVESFKGEDFATDELVDSIIKALSK